jgi:heme A synthase
MQTKNALLLLSVASLFGAIVIGAYVTVANYGDACGSSVPQDWPTCLGGVFPPLQIAPVMEYLHRIFAALSTLFLLLTTVAFWRAYDTDRDVKVIVYIAFMLLVVQVLLGGVVIAQAEQALLVAIHQGLAILTFGVAVAAFTRATRPA